MNWISKINGVFKVMGLSINAASLCTFFSVVILFFVILYGILQVLFKKKKIDSTTKSFYLFVGPWVFGFLMFTLGPMIYSFTMSFFDWELVTEPVFSGLNNYGKLLTDKHVAQSLKVTFIYTFVAVPLQVVLAFLLAALLNNKIRGINVFRTIFYLPNLISGVPQMVLFMWVFNPNFGLINSALKMLGIQGPGWFSDPAWSLPAVIIMSLWTVGGSMVIYLAGFQDISVSLYEQASIDGANGFKKFISITIPQMTPIIFSI